MWTTMDEATFNEWNRTKKATADTAKGYAPLIFTANVSNSFASWRECYDKKLQAQISTNASNP